MTTGSDVAGYRSQRGSHVYRDGRLTQTSVPLPRREAIRALAVAARSDPHRVIELSDLVLEYLDLDTPALSARGVGGPPPMVIDYEVLARHLAARMAPDALLDAEDVGALLKCSGRYFQESYALDPTFPRPVVLPSVGRINEESKTRRRRKRWKRAEVMEWIDAHRDGPAKPGRRRKPPAW